MGNWVRCVRARGLGVLVLATFATSWLCGCAEEDMSCEAIAGGFYPTYQLLPAGQMTGDMECGPVSRPFTVDIPEGEAANRMSNATAAGGVTVRTTVNVSGCSLNFLQEAFQGPERTWQMGGDLEVVSSEELRGQVYRIEYVDDAKACQSNYDAVMVQGQWMAAGSAGQSFN